MSPPLRLPPRLRALCERVVGCEGLADIACDHALVAQACLAAGRAQRAIAIDIAEGPLQATRARLGDDAPSGLVLRRGDGFALRKGEAEVAVVSGIGGAQMAMLLRRDRPRELGVERLLLLPHNHAAELRHALAETGWAVTAEWLVAERSRLYLGLEAVPGERRTLTVAEAELGRLAQDAEPALWRRWRAAELAKEARVAEARRAAGR